MRFQERQCHDLDKPQGHITAAGGPEGKDLDQIRREMEALFNAGDEAIQRGLSGDSEGFLTAGRQQGGQ